MKKTIVYIDGFNLYFGIRESGNKKFYWLNVHSLAENMMRGNRELKLVKYFTARVSSPPDKVKRQNTYIEAIETLPDVKIYYGKYYSHIRECRQCNYRWPEIKEKMTDVNIAVQLLTDAFTNKFDEAIILSADSDLVPPVRAVLGMYPDKIITVAFPPNRFSYELKSNASSHFQIGKKILQKSIFEEEIISNNGFLLKRPDRWK